jgi:hypothetical protein
MTLFTWLSDTFETEITESEMYLWEASTRLKREKQSVVAELLWWEYPIMRPNPLELDTECTASIFRFVAAENLECAFHCDPQTDTETVRNLARIMAWKISEWEHVHIAIHPNYHKAKTEDRKPYENLLAYFEVKLCDLPQTEVESIALLSEFRKIHNATLQWLSNL